MLQLKHFYKQFKINNMATQISNVVREFDFSTDNFSTNTNWIYYLKTN